MYIIGYLHATCQDTCLICSESGIAQEESHLVKIKTCELSIAQEESHLAQEESHLAKIKYEQI